MNEQYNGIVQDPRSDFEKSKDYKHEDLAQGDIVLVWKEYDETFTPFPIQNQNGSSSCVSQATSKILAMHEVKEGRDYKQLCPKFIYDNRANYPDKGMWLPNALEIACKSGTCLESLLPCDMQGEAYMNDKSLLTADMSNNALQYRGKFYFEIKTRNIDEIAKVIEQGYGVLLGFRFDYDEWTDVPTINPNSRNSCGHGVAGTRYCLHNGEKAIMIEDSWGPHYGKGGTRLITETFLNEKCFYAGYVTSLPNYTFTKTLRRGSRGLEVKMLQEKLGITADGIFGKHTEQAVMDFQIRHNLVSDGIVGKCTNAVLNTI